MSEKLVIEIDAKVSQAERDLLKVNKQLDNIETSSKKADESIVKTERSLSIFGDTSASNSVELGRFNAKLSPVASSLLGVGAAAVTAVAGVAALTNALSNAVVLADNNARSAGLTAIEYDQMGFAAERYGLSVQELSDAYQDARRYVGEFLSAGSGAVQDFADAMGLSAEEARAFAVEMAGLSGEKIIQRMTNDLEEAGVSTDQLNQALDSMGPNLDKLLPLFTNNGEEAKRLAYELAKISSPITDADLETYRQYDEQTALLTKSFMSLATKALAPVAEKFGEIYEATAKFFASFDDQTIEGASSRVNKAAQELAAANEKLSEIQSKPRLFWSANEEAALKRAKEARQELAQAELNLQKVKDAASRESASGATGELDIPESTGLEDTKKKKAAELKELQELYLSDVELVKEAEAAKKLVIEDAYKSGKLTFEQYEKALIKSKKEANEELEKLEKERLAPQLLAEKIKAQQAEREKQAADQRAQEIKDEQDGIYRDLEDSLLSQSALLDMDYQEQLEKLEGNLQAQNALTKKYEADKAAIKAESSASDIYSIDDQISKQLSEYQGQDSFFLSSFVNEEQNEEYIESIRALMDRRNAVLAEYRDNALQAETLEHEASMTLLAGNEEAQLQQLQEHTDRKIEIENQYRDAVKENADKIQQIESDSLSSRANDLDYFANMIGTANATIFEDSKALQKAEVVISGIASGMKAWEWGMKIGGIPVAAAAAATSAAFSIAQLAAIESASISGGSVAASTGAAVTTTDAYISSEPIGTITSTDTTGKQEIVLKVDIGNANDTDTGVFLNKMITNARISGYI